MMSKSFLILTIYHLGQGRFQDLDGYDFVDEQACIRETDCDKTIYLDCFCRPPNCHCYFANDTFRMFQDFNNTGLAVGEACIIDNSCRYTNCHKISKTCLCPSEYHQDRDLCVEGPLGYPCAGGCSWHSTCDPTIGYLCRCVTGYYHRPNISTECFAQVRLWQNCDIDEACGTGGYCINGKCDCKYREQYEEDGSCYSKKKLGKNCAKNNYCINNVCSDEICVCPYGSEEIHGICTRNLFNITCQTDMDCLNKMNYTMCNIQKKICSCNSKTYQHNGTCVPKKRIGKICAENVECFYDYCKDSICKCRYGYYLFGEECTEGKKPGALCYLDEECHSLNIHSSCVNRFCQCSPMFHLEKKKYCVPVMGNIASCAFKVRIDMNRIMNAVKYLSVSWYQISKDIEQKVVDIYQTKLSATFISFSAFSGEYDGLVEALLYLKIIIDDISLNLTEILVYQLQLYEPIPFLPEPDEVKIKAMEGICMIAKPMISYQVKIWIIISTCLLFVTILIVIGTIWHNQVHNPKKYIPWLQKEFIKSVYIPPIEELMEVVRILLEDELIPQTVDKVLSYKKLQAVYIKYFYYSYYDFDYSYIYDINYPYETYMDTIEDDFNYEGYLFEDLEYMASSNDDYNYIFKEEYE